MQRTVHLLVVLVVGVAFGTEAEAHLNLTQPTGRYDKYTLKSPPCGKGDGPRSGDVATFRAGETIEVVWDEYVDHPGHYRIAFDRDGHDDFSPPECTADCDSYQPEFAFYVNETVLVDDIDDKSGGTYRKQVSLPEVACDRCTLQVIQVMYDKPPYSIPGNDNYYQCADLKLVDDSEGMDAGTSDASDATGGMDPDTGGADAASPRPDSGGEPGGSGSDTTRSADSDAADTGGADVAPTGELKSGCRAAGQSRPAPWTMIVLLITISALRRRR